MLPWSLYPGDRRRETIPQVELNAMVNVKQGRREGVLGSKGKIVMSLREGLPDVLMRVTFVQHSEGNGGQRHLG